MTWNVAMRSMRLPSIQVRCETVTTNVQMCKSLKSYFGPLVWYIFCQTSLRWRHFVFAAISLMILPYSSLARRPRRLSLMASKLSLMRSIAPKFLNSSSNSYWDREDQSTMFYVSLQDSCYSRKASSFENMENWLFWFCKSWFSRPLAIGSSRPKSPLPLNLQQEYKIGMRPCT